MTKRTRSRVAVPQKDPATGRWFFRIDLSAPGEPRRQAKRSGFATLAEAQEQLDKLRQEVREGTAVPTSSMTVGEYLDLWLSSTLPITVRETTRSSYSENLRLHVTPRIGHVRLQSLRAPALNDLYATLLAPGANLKSPDRGLSVRSVRYIHTIIRRALRDAVDHGYLRTNPADRANPPKASTAPARDHRTWTAGELKTFLAHVEASGDSEAPIWRVLATTGMRRGEVLGLRWADVDLERAELHIVQTVVTVKGEVRFSTPKTEAGTRTIALDDSTVARLRAHRATVLRERMASGLGQPEPSELVFVGPDGGPVHPNKFSSRGRRYAAALGLPDIGGPHGLRHTWATLAMRAGVPPVVVQKRLGHSHIGITLGTYSHATVDLDAGAAAQIAGVIDDVG